MSTIEMNPTTPEEDQKDDSLTDISTPINFSEATAAHFGISVQSFIPASVPSSNRKEKSRLAQLKARRRTNIGVRGSPETNSLIRFMAQQKMKTPPAQGTPELVRSSPFLPRVASTLRQKMASFQSLMGVEESEDCDVMPRQDSSTGGCITTRDYLSDGENLEAGKENYPPLMALPPNKKRRLGPSQGCEGEIREDSNPPLHFSLKEVEEEETSVKQKLLLSGKTEETAQALVISAPFIDGKPAVAPDAELLSPTESQQEIVFELQSINQPTPNDPAAASPAQPASHFQIPSISSLLEMKPTADSISSPTVKKKKKQVRFGGPLPPELFDKTLPPSTPLQKGGTPARAPTPGGALKLRSLLKTPQRLESPTSQPQQELSFGASPTLSMPRSRRMACTEEDGEGMGGKIPFPLEELENEAATAEEWILNTQPLNLDTAFNEEFLSQIETECETKAQETSSPMDTLPPEPVQEEEQPPQTDSEAQASGRSSKRRGKVTLDTTEAPARSGSRKRKLPEESEPVKRSSRSAAKTASGKMKASTATRRWNKKVDRSLYGSRAYASKNPTLSPITERLSFGLFFTVAEPLSDTNTAASQEPHPDLSCNGKSVSVDPATTEVANNNTSETGDMAALNASTTPDVSVSFPVGGKGSGTRRRRRLSGSKAMGKAPKGRKISVNGDQADGKLHDKIEENATVDCDSVADQEEMEKSKITVTESHEDGSDELSATNSLDAATVLNEESESPTILVASTGFFAGEEFKQALEAKQKQESHPEDDKMNHEVERGQGEQSVSQQENIQSGSDSHDVEAAAQLSLAPWQDDFNFEDVFKPVPTRGQRSVRRSLRNQSSADQSSGGLAWLPHTSPESIKESRRRTRGRRLSAALLAPAPELTQP